MIKIINNEKRFMPREEVFNENLSQILEEVIEDVSAESIIYTRKKRRLPDVRLIIEGIAIIIEARFTFSNLVSDAKKRIIDGLCEIAIALQYPNSIKNISGTSERLKKMREINYKTFLLYRDQNKQENILEIDLGDIKVNQIAQKIVESVSLAKSFYDIDNTVNDFISGLEEISTNLSKAESKSLLSMKEKINKHIGISDQVNFSEVDYYYMVFFILANTMIYHQFLANNLVEIKQLTSRSDNAKEYFLTEWDKILKIDYVPIFGIAYNLLESLSTDPITNKKINKIALLASNIVAKGVTIHHDFMGKIFTNFLVKSSKIRDQYASFFTSSIAGYMISFLTCDFEYLENKDIKKLRVLDPFSGSGTLLSNVYQQLISFEILSGSTLNNIKDLRKVLIEDILYGWDVLPFASYLCLLTLALHSKDLEFSHSNIYSLGVGKTSSGTIKLGSFEALSEEKILPNIDFDKQHILHTTEKHTVIKEIDLKPFDVVVMNPPYKRSSGGGKAFGFISEENRKFYQDEMKKLQNSIGLPSDQRNVTYNVALMLAHKLLKENGRLAFILPKTFLSGGSSSYFRKVFLTSYKILYILYNSDKGEGKKNNSWNWSEDTDLSEIILVAEKGIPSENHSVYFVNFRKRPNTSFSASWDLENIKNNIKNNQHIDVISKDKSKIHVSYVKQTSLTESNLGIYSVFSSSYINNFIEKSINDQGANKLISLFGNNLKFFGMGTKEVNALLSQSDTETLYPVKWGHGKEDRFICIDKTKYGYGISKPNRTEQQIINAYRDWSGHLLIANRPQMKTKKILGCLSDKPLLSTAFWLGRFSDNTSEEEKRFVTLWLNSTFGLILFLTACLHKKGELFEFKKSQESRFLIPSFDIVSKDSINQCWDSLNGKSFNLYKEDYVYLSQIELSDDIDNSRFIVDKLFLGIYYDIDFLKKLYQELSNDPIFR